MLDKKFDSILKLKNINNQMTIELDLFSKQTDPGSLPIHLILINDHLPIPGEFCTTFDIDEKVICIHENFKAYKASKVQARIQLTTNFSPFIDLLYH